MTSTEWNNFDALRLKFHSKIDNSDPPHTLIYVLASYQRLLIHLDSIFQ